jgi:hypothetical protein
MYGELAMSDSVVRRWVRHFKWGTRKCAWWSTQRPTVRG